MTGLDGTVGVARLTAAAATWREVIAAGEDYCHGKKWENWYRGCEKVSPRQMLRRTLEVIESVKDSGGIRPVDFYRGCGGTNRRE